MGDCVWVGGCVLYAYLCMCVVAKVYSTWCGCLCKINFITTAALYFLCCCLLMIS